LNDVRKSPL